MSIWNKILVGLISVASIVMFYMAAWTLQTHKNWRELALKREQEIDRVRKDSERLLEGDQDQKGIRQTENDLMKLLVDRRRAWFKCDPKVNLNRTEGSAVVTVTIEQPSPHGIADSTILYAFEEADIRQDGRYIGEFKATGADEKQKQVVLVPTGRLSQREIERLATTKRPWVLYEAMPRDNREVFAKLTDDLKKAMLKTDTLAEYLNDGKPAPEGTPAERVVDGKYVRQLRDYLTYFTIYRVRRTLQVDRLEALTHDLKLMTESVALGKDQEQAMAKAVADAKEELNHYNRQREAVAAYRALLERELESVRADISKLIDDNKAMAGRLARLQLEAARRIDARIRAMASSK